MMGDINIIQEPHHEKTFFERFKSCDTIYSKPVIVILTCEGFLVTSRSEM